MKRWHKVTNRLRDGRYMMLTAAARGVLAGLDELLAEEGTTTANVTAWAMWLGLDRRVVREAFEAISAADLLVITAEAKGKQGTFYTVTTPDQPPTKTEADTDQIPTSTEAAPTQARPKPDPDPNRVPDKSPIDAGLPSPSLYRIEENRVDKKRIDPPMSPQGGHDADASAATGGGDSPDEVPFSDPPYEPDPDGLTVDPDGFVTVDGAGQAKPLTGGAAARRRGLRPAPKPRHEYHPEFKAFWDDYPNRVNKLEAGKLHKSLLGEGVTADEILAGLTRYKASDKWTREGGRYIEAPDVWLRNRRFEDFPAVARSAVPDPNGPAASLRGRNPLSEEERRKKYAW